MAAAQWILREDTGRWVYEDCVKGARDENAGWNMKEWETWKKTFEGVRDGEQYEERVRENATIVLEKMKLLEKGN
jgi:hypothetical protein